MPSLLIIINGPSASGKTTLSQKIAQDLQLPVFSRDEIKETLFDNFGWDDPNINSKYGKASYELLYQIVEKFFQSKQTCIIESNFDKIFSSPQIQKLIDKFNLKVIQIHCNSKPEILFKRFKNRANSTRHPGHRDLNRLAEFNLKLNFSLAHQPLDLPNSILIELETSNFKKIDYQGLIDRLKLEIY